MLEKQFDKIENAHLAVADDGCTNKALLHALTQFGSLSLYFFHHSLLSTSGEKSSNVAIHIYVGSSFVKEQTHYSRMVKFGDFRHQIPSTSYNLLLIDERTLT